MGLPSPLSSKSVRSPQFEGAPNPENNVTRTPSAHRCGGGGIMGELLTPTHLAVVAAVAFLLFGAKKLPELGKGMGEALRGFRDGIKGLTDETQHPSEKA
jgi:sec-independent protein translocase protein TatA